MVNIVRVDATAIQNGRDPNVRPSGLNAPLRHVQIMDAVSRANASVLMDTAAMLANSVSLSTRQFLKCNLYNKREESRIN